MALDERARLCACTGKLGVLGICIGGHLSFRAAMHDAERTLGEEPTQTGEAAGMALVRMTR